jgi:tetratricopeptide (TPR) repeat protein
MSRVAAAPPRKPEFRELERVPPPPPAWRPLLLPHPERVTVLSEAGGALGHVLWQALRHLRDWADCPPAARGAVFHARLAPEVRARRRAALEEAPELERALAPLFALIAIPRTIPPREVAAGCSAVAEWAEMRGYRETSLHFAEVATRAEPENPTWERIAGRTCRSFGEWHRAEIWFLLAIWDARARRKVQEYALTCLGYGALFQVRGNDARARGFYRKAANTARSQGLRSVAAESLHDLYLMCVESGEYEQAHRYLKRAILIYPIHHARLPALAHDVALLLVHRHLYTAALSLLKRLPTIISKPAELTLVWSTMACAAAGAGEHQAYVDARRRLSTLLEDNPTYAAAALLNLANAAWISGSWDEANSLGTACVELARKCGIPLLVRYGSDLLHDVVARRLPPVEQRFPSNEEGDEMRAIVMELLARLDRWRGPTWKRKLQAGPDEIGRI